MGASAYRAGFVVEGAGGQACSLWAYCRVGVQSYPFAYWFAPQVDG